MGIRAADCMTLLLADRICRREDAVVYRAGFPNKASSLALRLRNKSNNLAHFRCPLLHDTNHSIRGASGAAVEVQQAVARNQKLVNLVCRASRDRRIGELERAKASATCAMTATRRCGKKTAGDHF
jgi:hypothetical protein